MQAGKTIIVDGASADLGPEGVRRLLEHADYVVLKVPLLSRKLSLQELESSTRYFESLDDLVSGLTDSEKARLLFSVNVMDFSSGWMVPALQTQLQVDQHAKYPFKGYAIYYVSRYLPLRLTLSQTSSTSPAG
jgi:NAD(P)-dependent dehydrogenase (short-subunit alcohol dehydrogenase family)